MSASLVGSEMCIRDRDATPDGGPPVAEPAEGAARHRDDAKPKACVVTVSYTHLKLPTICSV
eukprot:12666624-Alexandrium_andersonii.AAC.1